MTKRVKDPMSLKDIQKEVDSWISQHEEGYWKPHEILARLTEEVGELSREINHRFGPKPKKHSEDPNSMGDEIGDILFTLTCLANSLKIDMDEGLQKVLEKYTIRDKDRWKKKDDTPDQKSVRL